MINMLPLIFGLAFALDANAAPLTEPPITPHIEVIAPMQRRATKPPRVENDETDQNGETAEDADFSADRYGKRESDADVKYERRKQLREKLARDIADFLADYEEYVSVSRGFAKRPHITERDGENVDNGENIPAPTPPSDPGDKVPRPVPPRDDKPVSPDGEQAPSEDGNPNVVPSL